MGMTCKDCNGTGRIKLLVSEVDCDCKNKKACPNCTETMCECDGTCDEDLAGSCSRCGKWVCEQCIIEGTCSNCFSKIQGGVI